MRSQISTCGCSFDKSRANACRNSIVMYGNLVPQTPTTSRVRNVASLRRLLWMWSKTMMERKNSQTR
eukprot:6931566-Prorocentrum_lima.AAC.1